LPTLASSNQVGNKSAIATNISCLRPGLDRPFAPLADTSNSRNN
jgi:hypothetical protein